MAWGQEKGADFHISALRACQYEIFDFVPCSLPLKTLILLTFLCFLIRRRGMEVVFLCYLKKENSRNHFCQPLQGNVENCKNVSHRTKP